MRQLQAQVMTKVVDIVVHLDEKLNNFFSIFSLLGGLGFPEVVKCKAAWKKVPKKTLKVIRKVWKACCCV